MTTGNPERSRVHELARLSTPSLLGLYLSMREGAASASIMTAVAQWDRDRLVTAIRDIEDPR